MVGGKGKGRDKGKGRGKGAQEAGCLSSGPLTQRAMLTGPAAVRLCEGAGEFQNFLDLLTVVTA